ncbi:MAG: RNA methyltransferase [Myxococcales bacterium]|nr:RNA methyltransferase [Myxococcales bacterium]USN50439.1 MAG: RNA methyltransferase [Myxococcales bacterium]
MAKINFIYGVHAVSAVLKYSPHRAYKLILARKKNEDELLTLARVANVSCDFIDRNALENRYRVGSDAQGVVLECAPFSYTPLEEIIERSESKIMVLDSWQDAANLGRAARAALLFGASGLIIATDRCAQITNAAEKSAVGALARLPVARVANLASALKKIAQSGFFIYGADQSGSVSLRDCDFAQKIAIVVGQEGEGIRPLIMKQCDMIVNIPMKSDDICLNAGDTALLFLYELSFK